MPRKPRIIIPGEMFHVTQRGNYQQPVFEDDQDRVVYLKLLQKYKQQHALNLFAYCLMSNHVHLIVKPEDHTSLAKTMAHTHQNYALYFHKRRKRQGHLWQQRYYSCLLYGQHILQAIRYVERNPVRAGMVAQPWEYVWSSVNAHLGKVYKIITLEDSSALIKDSEWKDFISSPEDLTQNDQLRQRTLKGSVLGAKEDIQALEERLGRKVIFIPKKVKKMSKRCQTPF